VLAAQADGAAIETVASPSANGELEPLQDAFSRHHALQCGFCTAGMLLAARDLLQARGAPTEDEIRRHLGGNVCRCTGYTGIVAAVREVAGT
jgi:aerobic-type carbon monoxide dehydrogenase small subunit (CoxS/CutS family)